MDSSRGPAIAPPPSPQMVQPRPTFVPTPYCALGRCARLRQTALAATLQFLTAIFIVRLSVRLFRSQHLLAGQPIPPQSYIKTLLHNS